MTTPTPEQMRALADRADDAGVYELNETTLVDEMATALRAATDQLEAVRVSRAAVMDALTPVVDAWFCQAAEPDDREFEKRLADAVLRLLGQADEQAFDPVIELHVDDLCVDVNLAEQLTAVALDNAPHADGCASRIRMHFHKSWPCDCWKSGVL